MFTVEERERVHDHVLELARADERVVAGALVGSLALTTGDRWSDLDLTFGVADGAPVHEVLEDWTRDLERTFGAVVLFDLPAGPTIYRVLLLPGSLQVDVSFTPESQFGAAGPKFRLIFGSAVERAHTRPPDARELFGMAVHHALRARFCIERGRLWQAEYWLSAVRDYALTLACRRRGLEARYARGADSLPANVLAPFEAALARSLEPDELLRALEAAIAGLLRESAEAAELAARIEDQLRELTSASWTASTPPSAEMRKAASSSAASE